MDLDEGFMIRRPKVWFFPGSGKTQKDA